MRAGTLVLVLSSGCGGAAPPPAERAPAPPVASNDATGPIERGLGEPTPAPPPLPVASLSLAGGAQCTVTQTRVGKLAKPTEYHYPDLEIGYGPAGGMVVLTIDDGHCFTLPLDAAGAPQGELAPFDGLGDLWVDDVIGFERGFVVLVDDKDKITGDSFSAYWIEPDGSVRHPAISIPLEPLTTVSRAGPVGDRFLLAAVDKDLYGQNPTIFEVALITLGRDGRLLREHLEYEAELPDGWFVSGNTALSKDHWVTTMQVHSHGGESGPLEVFHDGERLPHDDGFALVAPVYLSEEGRSGFMQLVGDDLVTLQGIRSGDTESFVVVTSPEGESSEVGIKPTLDIRLVRLTRNGSLVEGQAQTQTFDQPLPAPFLQELFLDTGTKRVTRRTRYGLVQVGEATALEPPMSGKEIKVAWSGSHFVLAALTVEADHYFVDLRSLDCRVEAGER